MLEGGLGAPKECWTPRQPFDPSPEPVLTVGQLRVTEHVAEVLRHDTRFANEMYDIMEQHAGGMWNRTGEPSEEQVNFYCIEQGREVRAVFPWRTTVLYLKTDAHRQHTYVSFEPT